MKKKKKKRKEIQRTKSKINAFCISLHFHFIFFSYLFMDMMTSDTYSCQLPQWLITHAIVLVFRRELRDLISNFQVHLVGPSIRLYLSGGHTCQFGTFFRVAAPAKVPDWPPSSPPLTTRTRLKLSRNRPCCFTKGSSTRFLRRRRSFESPRTPIGQRQRKGQWPLLS